jgi:transposase-like protein
VNEKIKQRTRVVGIFPNDALITRLVGAVHHTTPGCTENFGSEHIRDRTKDLTSQSPQFKVDMRGASVPPE